MSRRSPPEIFEVDEHHRILAALATTGGPSSCLIQFDSHDDLGPPARLKGRSNLNNLRGEPSLARCISDVDIGTWILPSAYAGAFGTLLWITKWASNLPFAAFDVLVGQHTFESGNVALGVVCGEDVPMQWKTLWSDYCVPLSSLHPIKRNECVALRVVMTDAAGAEKLLDAWIASASSANCGGEARPARSRRRSTTSTAGSPAAESAIEPPPLPIQFILSIDLDYFSVRNPALRGLPWSDRPSFRRDLIKLAKNVPMERGLDFVTALESLVASEDTTPHDVWPAICACAGIDPAGNEGTDALALLSTAESLFNETLRSLDSLQHVLDHLLLAGLADHEATNEELDELEEGLQRIARRVLPRLVGPVLIARSEMYTPRRQLADIVMRARRAITAATA